MTTKGSARQVVSGPLAPFEAAFRVELARLGYRPSSIRDLVRAMARLSKWLEDAAIAPSSLTPRVVENVRIAQLGPVLRFLREVGEVPAADSGVGAGPVEAVLAEFRRWLAEERSLSAVTVRCYGKQARAFLATLAGPLDVALRGLDAGQVTSFMLDYCRGRNTESAKAAVTALRALLRFLHVAGASARSVGGGGAVGRGLAAGVVAAGAGRRGGEAAARQLRPGHDRRAPRLRGPARSGASGPARRGGRPVGPGRPGLARRRGGRARQGNRIDRLPLPVDVGEALAEYLTAGRPRCESAAVFCTVRAPCGRLSAAAVRAVMGHACERAGLARLGAHRRSVSSQETISQAALIQVYRAI
jgi:hypothetical protein